jgi:hypothetical protein
VLRVIAGATPAPAQTNSDASPTTTTMFPHAGDDRWWLSGQVNLIWQAHGQFTSPYQGENSLRPEAEHALSTLWTIYTGVKLARRRSTSRQRPSRWPHTSPAAA